MKKCQDSSCLGPAPQKGAVFSCLGPGAKEAAAHKQRLPPFSFMLHQ